MKRCSIISYIQKDPAILIRDVDPDTFIICADIGLSYALQAGLVPDLIVGDFDSFDYPKGNDLIKDVPVVRLPVVKDHTDLDVSIQEAIKLGYTDISVYGGLGGRLDQTVANIQLMIGAKEKGVDITVRDLDNQAWITTDHICLEKKDGFFLSLFAVNGRVTGLDIKGTFYELENGTLTEDFPLGVSNEINADHAEITIGEGMLLVVMSRKH